MNGRPTFPKLLLPDWFDEACAYEIEFKGYFEHAQVQLASLDVYKVFFIEPNRLTQMLNEVEDGCLAHFAEAGMIVLSKVTIENMESVLPFLQQSRFFDRLKATQ